MLDELERGWPSHAAEDIAATPKLGPEEIRERMSGNICRCGAYPNIVAAIEDMAR
jgi:xanthine dehydrogenase YagT iron-sulfur-binding subunit